jgi:lipoprotein NlpI
MMMIRGVWLVAIALVALWSQCAGAQQQKAAEDVGPDGEKTALFARVEYITGALESGRLSVGQTAEALRQRGVAYSNLLQHDKALADFNRSLESAPGNGTAYTDRGITHHALKNYDAALADFTRATQLSPDFAHAYFSRGHLHYYRGRYAEALQDFGDAVALAGKDEFPYMALWHYLAAIRSGQDGRADIIAMTNNRDLEAWPGPVIRLFRGEASPDEALQAAKGDDKQSARLQQCEAQFYVGQHYLLKGDTLRAKAAFDAAVATQAQLYIEYTFGRLELEKL